MGQRDMTSYNIYAEDDLIAIVIRHTKDTVTEKRTTFYTNPKEGLQVAQISIPEKTTIPAHYHLPRKRELENTQEVLVVLSGMLVVSLYDNENKYIDRVKLLEKDTIVLLSGGHEIQCHEDTKIIEVKLGPYTHRSSDKVDFKVKE